jgi:hypothetical protein
MCALFSAQRVQPQRFRKEEAMKNLKMMLALGLVTGTALAGGCGPRTTETVTTPGQTEVIVHEDVVVIDETPSDVTVVPVEPAME